MLGRPCRDERFAGINVGDVYRAERGDSVAHGPHLGVQQVEVVVPRPVCRERTPTGRRRRGSAHSSRQDSSPGDARALPRMTVEGQAWQVHGARAWRTRTVAVRYARGCYGDSYSIRGPRCEPDRRVVLVRGAWLRRSRSARACATAGGGRGVSGAYARRPARVRRGARARRGAQQRSRRDCSSRSCCGARSSI